MYGDKSRPQKKKIIGVNGQEYERQDLEHLITKEQFLDLQAKGNSITAVSKLIGFNQDVLRKLLKKEGWATRPRSDFPKSPIYNVDTNFLNGWTKENAWFYGWFLSDGSLDVKANHIKFHIHPTDIDVLEKIKEITKFEGSIVATHKKNGTTGRQLRICRKKLVEGLLEKGCPSSDKTNTYTYPTITLEYERHFLRGIFEGDGHIRSNRWDTLEIVIASASNIFVGKLQERYLYFGINTSIKTHKAGGSGRKQDLYTAVTKSNLDALKMCWLMYEDVPNGLLMNRKYEKFIQYVREYYYKRNRRNKEVNTFIDKLLVELNLI
ncbi:LAGLIDADG family homing endonuclease [Peribacillus frigoritolerans]